MKTGRSFPGAEEPQPKRLRKRTTSDLNVVSAILEKNQSKPDPALPRDFSSFTSNNEVFIPEELLVDLFKLLPRFDIASVKQVCKYWFRCGSHPSLAWRPIYDFTLKIHSYKGTSLNSFPTKPFLARIVSLPDPNQWAVPTDYDIFDRTQEPPTPLALAIFHGWGIDDVRRELHEFFKPLDIPPDAIINEQKLFEELFEVEITPDHMHDLKVSISINIYTLERFVIHNLASTIRQRSAPFMRRFLEDYHPTLTAPVVPDNKAFFPPITELDTSFDVDKDLNVKLFTYQKNAIAWMRSVENAENPYFKYISAVEIPLFRPDILWDSNLEGRHLHSERIVEIIHKVNFKGAILADEMGLGKTLEVLGLIILNPRKTEDTFTPGKIQWVYDPNTVEIGSGRALPPFFKTKATLVICPNHLVKQWKEEASKHVKKLTVFTLATIREYKALTYQNVVDADLIIMSHQMGTFPSLLPLPPSASFLPFSPNFVNLVHQMCNHQLPAALLIFFI